MGHMHRDEVLNLFRLRTDVAGRQQLRRLNLSLLIQNLLVQEMLLNGIHDD